MCYNARVRAGLPVVAYERLDAENDQTAHRWQYSTHSFGQP